MRKARGKITTLESLKKIRDRLKLEKKRVVFTNGCFDLLHPGHVRYLEGAREQGDVLIVAVNSDRSVRELKGENRPVTTEQERAEVVASLDCVDWVVVFDAPTPLEIIRTLLPDVLVKGADWPVERIVGRDLVESSGGHVLSVPFQDGFSTTEILRRIREQASAD